MKLPPELVARLRTGDLDAYRVAADVLLEQGDPRAQTVALAVASSNRPNPATRRQAARLAPAAAPPFTAPGVSGFRMRRGFVDEVTLRESSLDVLPELLALEPITALRVEVESGTRLAAAMTTGWFGAISRLTVTAGAPVVRHLKQPAPSLKSFFCRAPLAFESELPALFPSLECLWVTRPPDDRWLAAWAAFPQLKQLSLPGTPLRAESVNALAASRARLEVLDLGAPTRGTSTPILRSTSLTSLHTVSVGTSGVVGDLGLRSVEQLGLPALRHIRWHQGVVPTELRAALRQRKVRIS